MEARGTITLTDARLVHEFAEHMQPLLREHDYTLLLKKAQTVQRISYCCIADAQQRKRFSRQGKSFV
jgi:hypothetical protein